MELKNILFDQQSNPSGICFEILLVPHAWIQQWPTRVDARYSGNIKLESGKLWTRLYCSQGKGSLKFEPVGDDDNTMYVGMGHFKFPSLSEEALLYTQKSATGKFVYLVRATTGQWHVVGDPFYISSTRISGTTGDAAGSDKGLTIEVEQPTTSPMLTYSGMAETSEYIINCGTGRIDAKNTYLHSLGHYPEDADGKTLFDT